MNQINLTEALTSTERKSVRAIPKISLNKSCISADPVEIKYQPEEITRTLASLGISSQVKGDWCDALNATKPSRAWLSRQHEYIQKLDWMALDLLLFYRGTGYAYLNQFLRTDDPKVLIPMYDLMMGTRPRLYQWMRKQYSTKLRTTLDQIMYNLHIADNDDEY